MKASPQCVLSAVEHREGVVISVHYGFCLQEKVSCKSLIYKCSQFKMFVFFTFHSRVESTPWNWLEMETLKFPVHQCQQLNLNCQVK